MPSNPASDVADVAESVVLLDPMGGRDASPDPGELSTSMPEAIVDEPPEPSPCFLCRRGRLDAELSLGPRQEAPGPGIDLAGAAAIVTLFLGPAPACAGLSPSLALGFAIGGGVVTCADGASELVAVEPLRPEVPFFLLRLFGLGSGPDPRLRFLITSVLRLRGRVTP